MSRRIAGVPVVYAEKPQQYAARRPGVRVESENGMTDLSDPTLLDRWVLRGGTMTLGEWARGEDLTGHREVYVRRWLVLLVVMWGGIIGLWGGMIGLGLAVHAQRVRAAQAVVREQQRVVDALARLRCVDGTPQWALVVAGVPCALKARTEKTR